MHLFGKILWKFDGNIFNLLCPSNTSNYEIKVLCLNSSPQTVCYINKNVTKTDENNLFQKPNPLEYPLHYRPGMGTENVGSFLRSMVMMLRPKRILEIAKQRERNSKPQKEQLHSHGSFRLL